MRANANRQIVAAAIVALLCATGFSVQLGPTSIELTPAYETEGAHAGATYRMAVGVRLDPGYHVNSEAPLDDFLDVVSEWWVARNRF